MPTKSTDAPVQTPPQAQSTTQIDGLHQAGDSRPREVEAEQLFQQRDVTAPTMAPPGTTGVGAGTTTLPTAVTGTWTTNVTVDALWAINETRNAFFHTAAGAWVKVFNGSDSAFTNLTTLASQAKQTAHPISYRVEADGMAHEIYLW
jgi:hypothetical protein